MNIELQKFLNMYENENTKRRYGTDIEKFLNHFNVSDIKQIENIKPFEWTAFVDSLKVKPSSKNTLIRGVRIFVKYLLVSKIIKREEIMSTKVNGMKSFYVKNQKKIHTTITNDELNALLDVADEQDKIMLGLLRYCGLREAEMASVKINDIDFKNRRLIILGKGSKKRKVVVPQSLLNLIQEYVSNRKYNSEYILTSKRGLTVGKKIDAESVNIRIKSLLREAGFEQDRIDMIHAHTFRSVAITAVAKKHGILAAQIFAGHENQETTRLYIDDEEIISSMMQDDETVFDVEE